MVLLLIQTKERK